MYMYGVQAGTRQRRNKICTLAEATRKGEDSIKEKKGWAETESGQRKRRQGTVSYLLLLELIMSDGTGSV